MSKVKQFLDANVWDGEDRSGCKNDLATFNPDELQELVEEALEHSLSPILESIGQDIDKFTEATIDTVFNTRNNARVWELKRVQRKLKQLLRTKDEEKAEVERSPDTDLIVMEECYIPIDIHGKPWMGMLTEAVCPTYEIDGYVWKKFRVSELAD